jgi:hypothetical protein
MRFLRRLLAAFLVIFILPTLAAIGWWSVVDRPGSWRNADWSSAGVLPRAEADAEAAVYVMAARTGGLKGALAVHSWLVTKAAGSSDYVRYDKVSWGSHIRRNIRPADGRWYSNEPWIVHAVHGAEAERAIPRIEAAVAAYPYSGVGGYRVWPGPNSNSFVAHVLREVPELGARLPGNATGRDYAPGIFAAGLTPSGDVYATLGGYAGFSAGPASGLELQFLGVVAGLDFAQPGIKIPGFGTWSWGSPAIAASERGR